MASRKLFGKVKKIIHGKKPSYEVQLDNGEIRQITHASIKPKRASLLNLSARISIVEVNGVVQSASTDLSGFDKKQDVAGNRDRLDNPKKPLTPLRPGIHLSKVTNNDPQKGSITFVTEDGHSFRIHLERHNLGWQQIFIGRQFEIQVSLSSSGSYSYKILFKQQEQKPSQPKPKPSQTYGLGQTPSPVNQIPERPQPVKPQPVISLPSGGDQSQKQNKEHVQEGIPEETFEVEVKPFGIDLAYFRARQKENHRFEIMAFLAEHLDDDFIEWYQMRSAQQPRFAEPRKPLKPEIGTALRNADREFNKFYNHQARALDSIRDDRNLIVVTQTASGKTMCYNPAIFEHFVAANSKAHALYIFPLNALMVDQKEKIDRLVTGIKGQGIHLRAEILKGGLGKDHRYAIAQDSPHILATNPEMLGTILRDGDRWDDFFSGLQYVVIDEVHSYRGILGMHMAGILRRLLLSVHRLGVNPQFILSSATVSNPLDLAARLTSLPEESFDLLSESDDGSRQECKHWAMINPDSHQDGGGYSNYLTTAAMTMVELLSSKDQRGRPSPLNTILFAKSIRDVNNVHKIVQENLATRHPELRSKVRKYISADLSETEKREIYQGLKSGDILGVVSTNALEAGIDIGKLDACIIAGFPFWVMRMRQMAGRVGRSMEGLVLYVPHPINPIDQYYRNNPELLLTQPPEVFVVDPTNPYISRKHINEAAANHNGIKIDELAIFGHNAITVSDQAVMDRVMFKNGERYFGKSRNYKNLDDPYAITGIRSQQQIPYVICLEDGTPCNANEACFDGNNHQCKRRITILDQPYAYRDCHPDAIYESMEGYFYQILSFDDYRRVITAKKIVDDSLERTFVEEETTIDIIKETKPPKQLANGITIHLGEVKITRSFTGYFTYILVASHRCRKCKLVFDENINKCPKCSRHTTKYFEQRNVKRHDFPEPYVNGFVIPLQTMACWMTVPTSLENRFNLTSACKLPGEMNKVTAFLKGSFRQDIFSRYRNLNTQETNLLKTYHEKAGRLLRARNNDVRETILYPGIYGQCLISTLRENLPESRSLEIFQQVTDYPVTKDLKHICRNCQSSVLLPAMHTLEHSVRMRYPSIALGDSSDISGHTALGHPQTGAPTIFWYDNYQGSLGAADKIFEQIQPLLSASENNLTSCTCTSLEGCPNCTQIGHCNLRNNALNKLAGRMLIDLALNKPFHIPYEPFVYKFKQKSNFKEAYEKNEFANQPHGVGSESPDFTKDGKPFDPFDILHVQQLIHDPVLKKAYEVRSIEITDEIPQITAAELNHAYEEIFKRQRPKEWNIKASMTPYQVLEILPQASFTMIQRIYRVIAREVHPDYFRGTKEKANEMMKLVNHAYEQARKKASKGYDRFNGEDDR